MNQEEENRIRKWFALLLLHNYISPWDWRIKINKIRHGGQYDIDALRNGNE